jgi:hypothetical protein
MHRPTREGDFLKELLKDFRGVLVSDFYAAYDSIACPQQKCLIHLMRDINQELLDYPFDEELQSITRPFGTLLRNIVTTVDQHGLKRRYLERHKHEVEAFFCQLGGQSFRSEAAEGLRTRLEKHRDKLFTFIGHDGVPWNNNNAENAIKRFAYYREDTVGLMKEPGLNSYLVLLSICHTCRYKGVSFLKFLLSKELDVDIYGQRKRQKRPATSIESYPAEFVPPPFKHLRTAKQACEPVVAKELAEMGKDEGNQSPTAIDVVVGSLGLKERAEFASATSGKPGKPGHSGSKGDIVHYRVATSTKYDVLFSGPTQPCAPPIQYVPTHWRRRILGRTSTSE